MRLQVHIVGPEFFLLRNYQARARLRERIAKLQSDIMSHARGTARSLALSTVSGSGASTEVTGLATARPGSVALSPRSEMASGDITGRPMSVATTADSTLSDVDDEIGGYDDPNSVWYEAMMSLVTPYIYRGLPCRYIDPDGSCSCLQRCLQDRKRKNKKVLLQKLEKLDQRIVLLASTLASDTQFLRLDLCYCCSAIKLEPVT